MGVDTLLYSNGLLIVLFIGIYAIQLIDKKYGINASAPFSIFFTINYTIIACIAGNYLFKGVSQ